MRLMTRIEAIPLHTMELGLRWDWVTFHSGSIAWRVIPWASTSGRWCPLMPCGSM